MRITLLFRGVIFLCNDGEMTLLSSFSWDASSDSCTDDRATRHRISEKIQEQEYESLLSYQSIHRHPWGYQNLEICFWFLREVFLASHFHVSRGWYHDRGDHREAYQSREYSSVYLGISPEAPAPLILEKVASLCHQERLLGRSDRWRWPLFFSVQHSGVYLVSCGHQWFSRRRVSSFSCRGTQLLYTNRGIRSILKSWGECSSLSDMRQIYQHHQG